MIEKKDGKLFVGSFIVEPTTTLDEFRKTEAGERAKVLVQNGDWVTFQIDEERGYGLNATFKNQRLQNAKIYLINSSSWSDWSEEKELQKKAKHDELLMRLLGKPPYRFSWGEVESIFDKRGGSSSIVINYTQ